MTVLLLVRHGSTPWTSEHRLQGGTDIGLSDHGREDVRRLRRTVDGWVPQTLVVSPLARTRATAGLLSELPPVVDPRWAEAGLGEWEGLTPRQIGPDYGLWRAGRLVPPGGEPQARVRRRVSGAVRAAAAYDGPVLVVTHGGVIRVVLACFLGLTPERIDPVGAPSVTAVEVTASGAARLLHYNLVL